MNVNDLSEYAKLNNVRIFFEALDAKFMINPRGEIKVPATSPLATVRKDLVAETANRVLERVDRFEIFPSDCHEAPSVMALAKSIGRADMESVLGAKA